ncbi:MAG: SEL1-like repeat protein, partial [Clostridia bacterium]|nr:SEL1-like repeat protein [Clostridia bacterium]
MCESVNNLDQRFQELIKQAEQGDAIAQANLGYYFHIGEGVEKNLEEAVKWYRKGAE